MDCDPMNMTTRRSSASSQVLKPMEEKQLVTDLIKMGRNGPVIFDRHFFTLVRKSNILTRKSSTGKWSATSAQFWVDQLCQGASVPTGEDLDPAPPKKLFFQTRCQCTTVYPIPRSHPIPGVYVPLPEEVFKVGFKEESATWGLFFEFQNKQKQDKPMILQSWFKKSLDSCVLDGDTECQVPKSWFDLFPPQIKPRISFDKSCLEGIFDFNRCFFFFFRF